MPHTPTWPKRGALDARGADRSVEGVSSFRPLSVFPLVLVALACCSSQAPLVGQGGTCELATDCANGLICAPASGKSCPCTCTSNLQGIQQLPPAPDAGPGLPAADAAPDDDVAGLIPTMLDAASGAD
jgi:hypothetical protein